LNVPEMEEVLLCIAIAFAIFGVVVMSLAALSWVFWKWFNAPYFVYEILFKAAAVCLIVVLLSSWLLVAVLIMRNYVLS